MTKEIQVSEPQEMSGFKLDQIRKIKRAINFNMSDDDLEVFLHVCKQTGLDPVRKQIWAIPRGGKLTIQTSIDGARLIAERTGCYAPGRPSEFEYDEHRRLISATSFVKKLAGGVWHEIGEKSFLCEFMGSTPFWKKMPNVMLSKVSEMRALRRAFPDDLSGLLSDDEMDQADKKTLVDKQEIPVIAVKMNPLISETEWESLDTYLNGHHVLRKKLARLCKVDNLRNINQIQLEGCRAFVQGYLEKEKSNSDESNVDGSSDRDQ